MTRLRHLQLLNEPGNFKACTLGLYPLRPAGGFSVCLKGLAVFFGLGLCGEDMFFFFFKVCLVC